MSSVSEESNDSFLFDDENFTCEYVSTESNEKLIKCVSVNPYNIQKMTKKIQNYQKYQHPLLLPISSFSFNNNDDGEKGNLTVVYKLPENCEKMESICNIYNFSKSNSSIIAFGVASLFQAIEKTKLFNSKLDLSYILVNEKFEPFVVLLGISEFGESLYKLYFSLLNKIIGDDNYINSFKKEMDNYLKEDVFDRIIQEIFFSSKFNTDDENVENYHKRLLSKDLAIKLWRGLNQDNLTLNKKINNLSDEIERLKEQFGQFQQEDHNYKAQEYSIQELKNTVLHSVALMNTYAFTKNELKIPLSLKNAGIFSYLINSQETKFEKLVVPSQSSGDLYCIIDSQSSDNYSSGSSTKEYIKFEFPNPIRVNGFKIQSAHRSFLRTWKLKSVDDYDDTEEVIFKTKDDHSLDGVNKELIVHFDEPITSSIFIIEKNGVNWSNTKFFRVKNVEFFSDQPQFRNGVFKTLVNEAGGDPHKADVYITASSFDFKRFHKLSPSHSLCTLNDPQSSWYQFELTKGKAIVQGYRIQFLFDYLINKFTLKGSNDMKHWNVIDRQKLTKEIGRASCRERV